MGMFGDLDRLALKVRQVVERINALEFAGVDQAEVEIADHGTVQSFIEETVLAQKYGFLQDSFAQIIIERRADLAEEERQRFPVFLQVSHGRAEG